MSTLQPTVSPSYFMDLALKKHQILKEYLFSDAEAENSLSDF